jgi:hypothetical protein
MRHQLTLAAFLLASSTVACVDSQDPSTDPAVVTSDLSAANGNQSTADEAPMFGEEALFAAAAIEADNPTTDAMAKDPSVAALDARPDVDARELLIMWGKLPADKTATAVRDWSGSLTVSRGALVVSRTIAFEDRTDAVLPRTSPATVSFTSKTRPASDGLALRILDTDGTSGSPSTTPITLTYTPANGGTPATIDLGQLSHGAVVLDAGGGDKIVAVAERRHGDCEGGFMRGRWHAVAAHAGVYRGLVTNRGGEVIGHVRGIYGERANGDAVMFGKFIDQAGAFKGVIAGTFTGGEFHARWLDQAGEHGRLGGVYFEGSTAGGGAFVGRWAQTACSEDPAQP